MSKYFILLAFILTTLTANAQSKISEGESVDKIMAVVGSEIITKSELMGELMRMAYQNPSVDLSDKKLQEEILNALIDNKLLVAAAMEDSTIVVNDDEIEQRFKEVINNMIRQYGSERRVEEILGKSISRIKFEYTDIIKSGMLADKMRQKILFPLKVSPRDLEEFYAQYKDSIGIVPEKYAVYHIVRNVSAANDAKESVFNTARRVRDSIMKGGDFADFAKRYSGDPGTANEGGNLGWFDKGKLFPEFEKAAFALLAGETSLPVETPFGFHIIQTLEKKSGAINTRHILFKIGQSNDDKDSTVKFLNSLTEKVKKGESFETLARTYSDDKNTKGFGGFLGEVALAEMPQNTQELLSKLKDGEVSEPMPYNSDPTKPAFHIVYKKETIPAHKADLVKDRKSLENMALMFKQNKTLKDYVNDLRQKIYWELK